MNLRDQDLEIRAASLDDANFIYQVREQSAAKQFFRSPEPTAYKDHLNWLENALADQQRSLLIVSDTNGSVAHVRLDRQKDDADEAEISIYVAPDAQGRGIGRRSIELAIKVAQSAGLGTLIAEVHRENGVSDRLFKRCGFETAGAIDNFRLYRRHLSD